jgi:hypothetical protein
LHPVLAGDGLEVGEHLERGLAQAFVARHVVGGAGGLALVVEIGCVDLDDLGGEAILGPGLGGQLLGAQAELVGVGPGDAPLVGDALGTLELAGELVLVEVALGDGVAEAHAPGAVGADRHLAHVLDTAGDGDVDHAGGHQAGGQVGGLLRRAALRVDRGGRHGEGQAGGEPRGAGHVERLHADLADAPTDDLADLGRIDAGALDDRLERVGQQVDRVDGREAAVATPDGRADSFDDDDFAFAHGVSLFRDLTERSSRRGVLAVGTDVALAHGAAQGGAGLLDATKPHGLGGGIEPPVGPGALVDGGGIALGGQLGGGNEVELCIHGSSMQRGCDS